jgi:hypothetical protein
MAVFVTLKKDLEKADQLVNMLTQRNPKIVSIMQVVNDSDLELFLGSYEKVLFGRDYIEDELCSCTFRISAKSFYQINPTQTEKLYEKAVELAKVMYAPNEKWDFAAGKMFVVHGGYENYVNVLLVREFSDFNSNIEVYQTGVQGTYHVSDDHHLTFQVVNNRSESHHELFAYPLPDGIQAAKVPFLATLNWDGFFADKAVRLLYSTSVSRVAHDKNMYYFTCGNIYEKGPILAYFDVMYTRSQLDKSQRLTSLFGGPVAQNVQYLTLIADFEYQFTPKWNAYVKGAYETSNVYKDNGMYKKGHYLTTWNAQACVEWLPFTKEKGLKFYLHYVYKGNQLQDLASAFNAFVPDTQRISLGLTYSIPVL